MITEPIIFIAPDIMSFICPGCGSIVGREETLLALGQGVWACDARTWSITTEYVIEEQALA